MESGIIPWLIGGLGNQMFIVVAGWLAAKYHTCPLYLLKSRKDANKHNRLGHNYLETIFSNFGTHLEKEYTIETLEFLKTEGYIIHSNSNSYVPYSFINMTHPHILFSYYQFYPPMELYEHEIRSLFLKGLSTISLEDLDSQDSQDSEDSEDSAFLHIHRGDYLPISYIHPICSLDYYKEGLRQLSGKVTAVFVFSDDIEWVKQQVCWKEWSTEFNIHFEIYENNDELQTLKKMSQCKGGAICANSTFSWWGAFLGAYSVRSPVIVPKQWSLADPVIALFPDEWISV